jgi:hypothetical protein
MKSNAADATLRKNSLPKPTRVVDAKEVKGAARECAKQQVGEQWPNFTDNELARKAKQ